MSSWTGFNIILKGKTAYGFCNIMRQVNESDEELTGFCFDIYDLNEDGFISREEIMLLLTESSDNHHDISYHDKSALSYRLDH